jgi:hypothetical protein
MSANAKLVDPVTGNSTLVRPRYSPGLLLRDDDLKQGVDYTRDLSRLLFRSLFGCGVVCGLEVKPTFTCGKLVITVGSGVALDCHGDPIEVPGPQSVSIDPTCNKEIPSKLWLVLRRTEKYCAPRSAECSCDDEDSSTVCTREREGFEIRVLNDVPDCACGCTEVKSQTETDVPKSAEKTDEQSQRKKQAAAQGGGTLSQGGETPSPDCRCADPTLECYQDHYCGKCGCECCDCEWVMLAVVMNAKQGDNSAWSVDHSVRRFVRPVLMRDPVVWRETHPNDSTCKPI